MHKTGLPERLTLPRNPGQATGAPCACGMNLPFLILHILSIPVKPFARCASVSLG
ncbi:MAG: hypothetical protein WCI51_03420 [Lentisphaerota bacterium]